MVIGVVILLVIWPSLLGRWVAVSLGADPTSTTRTVVGWTFQVLYLAALAAAGVGALVGSSRTAALICSMSQRR